MRLGFRFAYLRGTTDTPRQVGNASAARCEFEAEAVIDWPSRSTKSMSARAEKVSISGACARLIFDKIVSGQPFRKVVLQTYQGSRVDSTAAKLVAISQKSQKSGDCCNNGSQIDG